jgi:hypothetical protein
MYRFEIQNLGSAAASSAFFVIHRRITPVAMADSA